MSHGLKNSRSEQYLKVSLSVSYLPDIVEDVKSNVQVTFMQTCCCNLDIFNISFVTMQNTVKAVSRQLASFQKNQFSIIRNEITEEGTLFQAGLHFNNS